MAVETRQRICQSGLASPGGSTALRTRCTRRSVLVNVPSFSAKQVAGRMTSRQLGRLGHEDFLADEELELLQALDDLVLVRLAQDRVLAEDVEAP